MISSFGSLSNTWDDSALLRLVGSVSTLDDSLQDSYCLFIVEDFIRKNIAITLMSYSRTFSCSASAVSVVTNVFYVLLTAWSVVAILLTWYSINWKELKSGFSSSFLRVSAMNLVNCVLSSLRFLLLASRLIASVEIDSRLEGKCFLGSRSRCSSLFESTSTEALWKVVQTLGYLSLMQTKRKDMIVREKERNNWKFHRRNHRKHSDGHFPYHIYTSFRFINQGRYR